MEEQVEHGLLVRLIPILVRVVVPAPLQHLASSLPVVLAHLWTLLYQLVVSRLELVRVSLCLYPSLQVSDPYLDAVLVLYQLSPVALEAYHRDQMEEILEQSLEDHTSLAEGHLDRRDRRDQNAFRDLDNQEGNRAHQVRQVRQVQEIHDQNLEEEGHEGHKDQTG
jgi:hypothetical protein